MSRLPTFPTFALLAALVLAVPAAAQDDGPAGGPPRFLLESIEVRGTNHVSPAILVSESLLAAGESYTEAELRDAVYRVRRLPFVLDVDVGLERGSERGRYVLVVDVLETKRFFYATELLASKADQPVVLDDERIGDDNMTLSFLLGWRFAAGTYGVAFAAVGDGGLQVGYSRYNLFRRNGFLSLAYATQPCCATQVAPLGLDPGANSWTALDDLQSATLTLGVPLGARQSLRVSAAVQQSDEGWRRPAVGDFSFERFFRYEDLSRLTLELAWLYDTTDDPVFPTRGDSVVAAVEYRTLDAELVPVEGFPFPTDPSLLDAAGSRLVRLSAVGRRHWPVGGRHSVSASLGLAVGASEVDDLPLAAGGRVDGSVTTWEVTATIRHALSLVGTGTNRPLRRLRWENAAEYALNGASPDFDVLGNPLEVLTLRSELVYRSSWGVVRFGFRILDLGRTV